MTLADLQKMVNSMKMGLGPLHDFQKAALIGLEEGPAEHAAFFRLLADLAERFIDLYDEVPLWQTEASERHAELCQLVDGAVDSLTRNAEAQLRALNVLAAAKF